MKIQENLRIYSEYFMEYDIKQNSIISICPKIEGKELPCQVMMAFEYIFPNLTTENRKHLMSYVESGNLESGINLKIRGRWFAIDMIDVDENTAVIRVALTNKAFQRFENNLTLTQLDPLSNVLNKLAISVYVDEALDGTNLQAASLFMVDIDYFKNINDSYGHIFGDQVIIAIGKALKEVYENAKVGRVGGDEFVIFIEENLQREELRAIARRIRFKLDKLQVGNQVFHATATIGICQYPKDGKNYIELFSCCDKALYRGKQKGRDCYIIYDPLMHKKKNTPLVPEIEANRINVLSIGSFIQMITSKLIACQAGLEQFDLVFAKICDYFNLDRAVYVDKYDVKVVHYHKKYKDPSKYYKQIDLESYAQNFIFDNAYMLNDIEFLRLKDEKLFKIYEEAEVKSFIQFLITDSSNRPLGFISYEMLSSRRVWQTSELSSLTILSNLIKSFYIESHNAKK